MRNKFRMWQDTESTCKNHFYTSMTSMETKRTWTHNNLKENKIPRNKDNQGDKGQLG